MLIEDQYAGHYEGYDVGQYTGRYRVTIQEAAERLGVKEGAIRKRMERGTIRSEKESETGRVYVYVDEPPGKEPIESHDAGYDNGYDKSHDAGYDMLIRSQQEQIEFLRRELERKDALLLNMTEAMKALNPLASEVPSEPRESDISASEERGNGDVPPESERRSWWRRLFDS
jgi:hypothetical protein